MTRADKIDHNNYIDYNFERLKIEDRSRMGGAKMQISAGDTHTNWINLTQKQVEKIQKILKTV